MIGKVIEIAGMRIQVLGDEGDSWKCRNVTTQQELLMDKAVVDRAIRLGKAEVVHQEAAPSGAGPR
jgi:hypothetical protein